MAGPESHPAARRGTDAAGYESEPLSREQQENIHRLWDELADFDDSAASVSLAHCMRTLCGWIGAQNAHWIGAVRMASGEKSADDPLDGWRIASAEVLRPMPGTIEAVTRANEEMDADITGDTTRTVVADAGRFRVYSLGTGIVDMEAFRKTGHYDFFYRRRGITDRIWVVFPVNENAESYFLLDTLDEGRSFSALELQVAAAALRGIKWFHRQQLLSHGLGISDTPLSPAERRMLPWLLSDSDEHAIALQLSLTPDTVHHYAAGIYRKFGADSRARFIAIWLSFGPQGQTQASSLQRLSQEEMNEVLSQERARLMQDMHDGLGASLVSALRVVENGKLDAAAIAEVLKGCIDDLRLSIDAMEPAESDLRLLLASFRQRTTQRLEATGIALHWEMQEIPLLPWLNPGQASHILRILQEAFANILKHTCASEIRVSIAPEQKGVQVTVWDNGGGFDLEQAQRKGGKGLNNQMRRAEAVGGKLRWESGARGTDLVLWLPLHQPAS